jgi:hypothetical protein
MVDVGYDLRSNPLEVRENDENQQASPKDPLEVSIGLITRSRAKKIKDAFNGLIQDIKDKSNINIKIRDDQALINVIHVNKGVGSWD